MTDERRPDMADADLVHYLDGQLDAAGRARVEAALAADATLAARLEQLRRRSGSFRALLARTDPPARAAAPPPPPAPDAGEGAGGPGPIGPGGWLLRAAAVVLLLAGVVSLVPPLRAWIFDGVLGRAAQPAPELPDAAALLPDPDTLQLDSIEVRFDSFEFELVAEQPNGSIRVRTADVATASVQIRTRTGLESFYRLPNGMRIINQRGSLADYEVVVPRRIRTVRLYMGGRPFVEYVTRVEGNADRTFDLGERPQR